MYSVTCVMLDDLQMDFRRLVSMDLRLECLSYASVLVDRAKSSKSKFRSEIHKTELIGNLHLLAW